MSTLLTFILPALAPVLADGVRGLLARLSGGAGGTPQNVAERVQLMQAETERLKALAELDRPIGEPSQWVVNLRASFRYIIIGIILVAAVVAVFTPAIPAGALEMLLDLAGASMAFVIGERMLLGLKK